MIVLDTNVVSEVLRPEPARIVRHWMRRQPATSLFITTITEAELLYGLRLLPDGVRRNDLGLLIGRLLTDVFSDRVLPFDRGSASSYADIAAERKALGRPISTLDAQIAAIARSRGATVATRNSADFEGCGIAVIDPWTG